MPTWLVLRRCGDVDIIDADAVDQRGSDIELLRYLTVIFTPHELIAMRVPVRDVLEIVQLVRSDGAYPKGPRRYRVFGGLCELCAVDHAITCAAVQLLGDQRELCRRRLVRLLGHRVVEHHPSVGIDDRNGVNEPVSLLERVIDLEVVP
jgi:hypothetical protein